MKKYIGPIIFGVLVLAYICVYLIVILLIPMDLWLKVLLTGFLIALISGLLITIFTRIKELKEEDEDDYRKY